MEFGATVDHFHTRLWSYHFMVPETVAMHFKAQGVKRVICHLNEKLDFQCAIMPAGDGVFFINLNKKIRETLNLREGSRIKVRLEEDTSTFGLPFPEELQEVLAQDPEGATYFDALTPGKKRNLIYGVSQVKDPDLRIRRALVMMAHLKKNEGKILFRQLYQELRSSSV